MDNNNYNGGRVVSSAIFALLAIASFFAFYYCNKYKETKVMLKKKELLAKTINMLHDSSSDIKINGVSASEYNTLYLEKENIEKQLSSFKSTKIHKNDLESAVSIKSVTTDTIYQTVYVDSVQALHALYTDSFINISATIYRDKKAMIMYENKEYYDLFNYKGYRHKFLFFRWGKSDKYLLIPGNPKTKCSIRAVKIIRKEGD